MAQRQPEEKITLDQVLNLVEKLTPEEQSKLRQAFLEDEEDIRISLERLRKPEKWWTQDELEQGLDPMPFPFRGLIKAGVKALEMVLPRFKAVPAPAAAW